MSSSILATPLAAKVSGRKRENNNHLERVKYKFDGFSQVRELTRKLSNEEHTYKYTYDVLGRVTDTVDPLGRKSEMAYEPYCTGMSSTSARGTRVRTSYDVLCRPVEVEAGDPLYASLSHSFSGSPASWFGRSSFIFWASCKAKPLPQVIFVDHVSFKRSVTKSKLVSGSGNVLVLFFISLLVMARLFLSWIFQLCFVRVRVGKL